MIHDILSEYLASSGLPADVDAEAGRTVIEVDGTDGSWVIVGEAYEDLGIASIRAILAARVDVEHRDSVTLLLNRLNQNILLGAWSLDPEDGEVQFKTAIDFGGFAPTVEQLQPLVAMSTLAPEEAWAQIAAAAGRV